MTIYEVLWGVEETERYTWSYRSGEETLGVGALRRAEMAMVDLAKVGTRTGLFIDGQHVAGHDFEAELAALDAADEPVVHKTRTWVDGPGRVMNWRKARMEPAKTAMWSCSCGMVGAGATREEARMAARRHREVSMKEVTV